MFKPSLEKMEKKRDVKGLMTALKSGNPFIRRGAAEALGRVGNSKAVDSLIEALRDEKSGVRSRAAGALGNIGDKRAVESLIVILNDQDEEVRQEAAKALGMIRDPKAIDRLIQALKDENPKVRNNAMSSLGRIGGKTAVEPLMEVLKGEDTVARNVAMQALVEIGKPSVDSLVQALKDERSVVRSRAVEALGKMGDSRAIEHLIPALNDKDEWVRTQAAMALSKMEYKPLSEREHIDILIAKGEWNELAKMGEPAVMALIRVVESGSITNRNNAIDALGKIGDARAVQPLIKALWGMMGEKAAEALGEIGDKRAVQPLIQALSSPARMHVINALGKIGDPTAIQPLILLLKKEREPSSELIVCVKKALVKFSDQAIIPLILELYKAHGNSYGNDIAEVLGEIGDERAVDALISHMGTVYEDNQSDPYDEPYDAYLKSMAIERAQAIVLPAIDRVRGRKPKPTYEHADYFLLLDHVRNMFTLHSSLYRELEEAVSLLLRFSDWRSTIARQEPDGDLMLKMEMQEALSRIEALQMETEKLSARFTGQENQRWQRERSILEVTRLFVGSLKSSMLGKKSLMENDFKEALLHLTKEEEELEKMMTYLLTVDPQLRESWGYPGQGENERVKTYLLQRIRKQREELNQRLRGS